MDALPMEYVGRNCTMVQNFAGNQTVVNPAGSNEIWRIRSSWMWYFGSSRLIGVQVRTNTGTAQKFAAQLQINQAMGLATAFGQYHAYPRNLGPGITNPTRGYDGQFIDLPPGGELRLTWASIADATQNYEWVVGFQRITRAFIAADLGLSENAISIDPLGHVDVSPAFPDPTPARGTARRPSRT